jgi:excinuclease ABC subunit C
MDLHVNLKNLPSKPGVYKMIDASGTVIYVGKAKNLKNRVSQYFTSQKNRPPKVTEMIGRIHTFDYKITDTEFDALIEECRLIQEIKPYYNRQMKNPKKYVYLAIPDEEYPKPMITYDKLDDSALYFGPFTSLHCVEKTLQYLNDIYPLRKCSTPKMIKRSNGCLFQELGTCFGVCTGRVTSNEYKVYLDKVQEVLSGKDSSALQDLSKKMNLAIEELEFEKAALYRDYYLGLRHVLGKQKLIQSSKKKKNIIVIEFMETPYVKLFLIKGSKLLCRKTINLANVKGRELHENLLQIIRDTFVTKPRCISPLTQEDIDEAQIIESYLKKNQKTLLRYWIPLSLLQENTSRLEQRVVSIIHHISLYLEKQSHYSSMENPNNLKF